MVHGRHNKIDMIGFESIEILPISRRQGFEETLGAK